MTKSTVEIDNLQAGDDIETDLVGGVHTQYVKISDGTVDGTDVVATGNGTETNSLRVTVASDSTGQTALAAGSAVVGEVTIGAATGATGDLAKIRDAATGAADVGVAMLARHREDLIHLTSIDDDYDLLTLDSLGQLHVNTEGHHVFNSFNTHTDFAALNTDTDTIASSTNHVLGDSAVSFNKVDGAANTVFGCIDDTFTAVDLGDISPHDIIQTCAYIPSLADVAYVFVRLGDTDGTNYNEWRIPDTALTAATWEILSFSVGDPTHAGSAGTGWDPSAIDYMAIGVALDAQDDTLSGIIFDQTSYHTNQHVVANLEAEVTSSISSPNINLHKVGNTVTSTSTGTTDAGTQRVTIASDDSNLAAMVVDLAAIEVTQDALVVDAAAMEVLLTNIDSDTNTIQSDTTGILADTAAIQTAVEIIDNAVHVDDAAFTLGTHSGTMMMGFAGTQSVDANDAGAIAMETDGAIHIHDGGNTISVDGTVTANPASGTIDTVTTVTTANLAAETTKVIGTVRMASGGVASGSFASGSVASGAFASGALASGAVTDLPLPSGAATSANQVAKATGGMSFHMLALAAEDNDAVIKASAATVYWISIQSLDATPVYLKLFDQASLTAGTDTADLQFMCPANATAANGAGIVHEFGPHGIQFATGLCALITPAIALDGNTAVSLNEVIVTIGYE